MSDWDIDQAEHYVRELLRAFGHAAANPRISRSCDDIRPGYFRLPTGSHTLYYRNRHHRHRRDHAHPAPVDGR